MKKLLFVLQFLCSMLFFYCSQGQGMVANPSFEITNACPNGTTPGIQPGNCPPWISVPGGTPDYFNPCSTSTQTDAPTNSYGYQQARTGNAYTGIISTGVSKEYIQVPLTTPMVAGKKYYASMYVNLANNSQFALDRLGFYFSNNALQQISGNPNNQPMIPQIVNPEFNYLTDTLNWAKIDGIYTAVGGEQWVAIGNFTGINSNTITVNTSGSVSRAYYYVEDVCVVDLNAAPAATSSRDTFMCVYPAIITPPVPGQKYLWSTGDTTATLTINTPGNYWVKTIQNCSYTIDSIIVKLKVPRTTTKTTDTFLCSGEPMELYTPGQAYNILWSSGAATANICVTNVGDYWVKYDLPNCIRHTDTFKVLLAVDQPINITDTIICNQSLYQLWAPEGYHNWQWSDGTSEKYILVSQSGSYWVKVKTEHNCSLSDAFNVTMTDIRQRFPDTTVCAGEPFSLVLTAQIGNGATSLWQDGTTLPSIEITRPGTYAVQVTDGPCIATSSMNVFTEYCDCPFLIPTAFTPNNDGLNDDFGVSFPGGCMVTGYRMQVFNRWGQMVYSNNDENKKWDGNSFNEPAPMGTYFYSVKFETGTRRELYVRKGDVVLIR